MAIPDYQDCMLPLLEVVADGTDYHLRVVTRQVADRLNLTDAERIEPLPSGQQTVIANRVAWAKTYLKKAGLLAQPVRGVIRITPEGRAVLGQKPTRIDNAYLKRYPTFSDFYGRTSSEPEGVEPPADAATPEETLEAAALALRNALADELIEKMKSCTPHFFERLVVELLVAMGYGGSLADAGQAIGRSGDGGIDGIIKEDKLGLDVVCVQAKRWEGTVGSREIRDFVGGMETYRSRKGVLITTSGFSKDATEYVTKIERRVVLIDGRRLAELMIDHGVGVATARTFAVQRIDLDYFDEGES